MFTDILESNRLGMVSVCDRLVPVVSALDHDNYHSDNSEGVSSISCRSDRSDSPEPGTQTGADTDNEAEAEEDSETEVRSGEREQEELRGEQEETESSPGTGRSSPQATPNSAMSISPANSEVGSRLIQNLSGGSSQGSASQTSSTSSLPRQANTPYVPKKRYEWPKARKNIPDRADLDTNWRQSASGPASDKSSTSSTSSGEREVTSRGEAASSSPRTPAASRSEAGVKRQDSINSDSRESRADLDSNWRVHDITTTLPPSGAKTAGKFKNKNQKHLEKGMCYYCSQN